MDVDGQQNDHGLHQTPESESMFAQARQRRKIAELKGKLEALKLGHTMKEKQMNYYLAQGRGLRHVVTLFNSIEDSVAKNDQRYDNVDDDTNGTVNQDRLLYGYSILVRTLPWFLKKTTDMEHNNYVCMCHIPYARHRSHHIPTLSGPISGPHIQLIPGSPILSTLRTFRPARHPDFTSSWIPDYIHHLTYLSPVSTLPSGSPDLRTSGY
ncbi:uncharacterized protein BJ212DRAFT_1481115 [Suillus subaureus]|uniref:Uncharacterized protein n=1 Tax=Suillus subaureus TaxID=48587 RepID=A0A9P7JD24_9AGAM|nr:uncharacterized protein BJ212DRAFT_1481115 [Suillus subaureus]KAG1816040.1 hypothetical protein BJ212DRAFT_1481115 [Suillus subaureus]